MKRKGRGFPLEYYPGEILSEREAGINRKMFLFRVTGMVGALTPNVSVMLPPPPTAINRIQFTSLDGMVSQTKPSSLIAPVITNKPDKSILTDLQLDEFNQISSKFLYGSISMDEAIFQLRGGGKFKDISLIVLYIWLYRLQNNHVEGFQLIRPPHQEWMAKGADQRPPYAGGYGSCNSGSSLDLTYTNDGFNELSQTTIQNAYSQIPNLSVEGTHHQVTAWSAAKYIHHSPDFGLDPRKYGMTQEDLDSIARNGLINHIRDGGIPPNDEYVKALQQRWKRFAEHRDIRKCGIETVMGEHVVKHDRTRIFLAFKVDSRESYTGYRLNPDQSLNHDKNNTIGKNYKN